MDEAPVMDWLASGLPLTLLVDMAVPDPHSTEAYKQEHDDVEWYPDHRYA